MIILIRKYYTLFLLNLKLQNITLYLYYRITNMQQEVKILIVYN